MRSMIINSRTDIAKYIKAYDDISTLILDSSESLMLTRLPEGHCLSHIIVRNETFVRFYISHAPSVIVFAKDNSHVICYSEVSHIFVEGSSSVLLHDDVPFFAFDHAKVYAEHTLNSTSVASDSAYIFSKYPEPNIIMTGDARLITSPPTSVKSNIDSVIDHWLRTDNPVIPVWVALNIKMKDLEFHVKALEGGSQQTIEFGNGKKVYFTPEQALLHKEHGEGTLTKLLIPRSAIGGTNCVDNVEIFGKVLIHEDYPL